MPSPNDYLLDTESVQALIKINKRKNPIERKSYYGGIAAYTAKKKCEGKNCELCPTQATCFRFKTQK